MEQSFAGNMMTWRQLKQRMARSKTEKDSFAYRYDIFVTSYSLSNFNHVESNIAQFHIGFKK